jgi:hypothetical protein
MVPSIAHTNRPRQYTPRRLLGSPLPASSPRSRSNNARNGARPIRRRTAASALGVGRTTSSPLNPAHIRAHTWGVTELGEQRGRQQQVDHDPRRQRPQPLLNAVGLGQRGTTISNGTIWVSSPIWPGAYRPPATLTTRLMTKSVLSGTPGSEVVLVDAFTWSSATPHRDTPNTILTAGSQR